MTQRRDIDSVLADHVPKLMQIEGVVGVYHGETEKKEPCVKVMVEKRTGVLEQKIPKSLEGYPVLIEETGVIRPLN